MNLSRAEIVARMPAAERQQFLQQFSAEEINTLASSWEPWWARPSQKEPPGDWTIWLYLAGRGTGKTRTASEWTLKRVRQGARRIVLVGRTAGDVRDTMLMGDSGILTIASPDERPKYEPSKRLLTFPSGATALLFSADKPDQLRGPQFDTAWCDELASFRFDEAWDMLMFGLRSVGSGLAPKVLVTTTPRPTEVIKRLRKDAQGINPSVIITRGSTYENRANLAPTFLKEIERTYEGTRLGRQEIYGEILDDNPGALWTLRNINDYRANNRPAKEDFQRIVVGVDPAVTHEENSDETGIIVVGVTERHIEDSRWTRHAWVLSDKSGKYAPLEWAKKAIEEYNYWKADAIVCEINNGGDLVTSNILNVNRNVRIIPVRASRGKYVRAEPAAALYEQGRVHHVGMLPELEDQMVSWDPISAEKSPDRMDALVWALYELILKNARGEFDGVDPTPLTEDERLEKAGLEWLLGDQKVEW